MRSIEKQQGTSFSRPVIFAILVAACSIIMLLTTSTMPGTYDEGITLTGAMRVAAGQIQHRDFYALYGPAHFYTCALLFKIFGSSLLLERIFYSVIAGLIIATV